jgi:hypothetical protein
MIGSAGQALETLKALLDEAVSEWANPAAMHEVPGASLNHRPVLTAKPVNHRATSTQAADGVIKIASAERRILTALAQYADGRSKVQVAILSGYAPNGGGFNNYLGALRSRGFIQGNG